MKVAISCDHILERKPVHRLVELASSMYPDATVFTLAHRQGQVLGPLEMHPIRSSFLSSVVKTEHELRKKLYLVPFAAKKLIIPCSFDLIINFSTGLSHGISHCEKTSVLNYFFSDDLELSSESLSEKIFRSYLKSWAKKMRKNHSHKIQSHDGLFTGLKVVRPFFNFEDFYFQEELSICDLALINPGDFSDTELKTVCESFISKNNRVLILGEKRNLDLEVEYIKNTCSGELVPLFEKAQYIIDGNKMSFPEFSLSCYASGRNVWVWRSGIAENYLGRELPRYFENVDWLLENVANDHDSTDTRRLYRNCAAKYSQLLFKAGLMRNLKDMGFPYRPKK